MTNMGMTNSGIKLTDSPVHQLKNRDYSLRSWSAKGGHHQKMLHTSCFIFLLSRNEKQVFHSFQNKNAASQSSIFWWRREWDSNPWTAFGDYTLSRRAPSTNSAISPKKIAKSEKRNGEIVFTGYRLLFDWGAKVRYYSLFSNCHLPPQWNLQ